MRLGLSSYSYPWSIGVPGSPPGEAMTLDSLLEHAIGFGVDVLQVADNLALDPFSDADLASFGSRADAAGIALEVGTRGIAPERIARYLQIARILGSPIVRVVVDSAGHEPTPAEVVELLRLHRRAFLDAGTVLAIENHDRFGVGVLRGLVAELGGDWVGICLDTVNSFGALEGPAVVVEALGPLAVNLHVKDFAVSRHGSQMGFTVEGRPAGQGSLDVPWLFGELARFGRTDLTAVLELWTPPEGSVEETIATERRWVEESIEYLRPLVARAGR